MLFHNEKKMFKIDESPWPFLVSTASLFLTSGAVLLYWFFSVFNVIKSVLVTYLIDV